MCCMLQQFGELFEDRSHIYVLEPVDEQEERLFSKPSIEELAAAMKIGPLQRRP